MKKLTSLLKVIALLGVMVTFNIAALGQASGDYQLDDGATMQFNAGTYTGTVTSTTSSCSSTAVLQTSGIVTLSGTYSAYYGTITLLDGSATTLNSASNFASKLTIGNTSYSSTTSLYIGTGTTLNNGDGCSNVITMDLYGRILVQSNLTLTYGGIQMDSYNDESHAPVLYFYPAATTPKITISESGQTILTNGTSNEINVQKNLAFDMTNAPQTSPGTNTFVIGTFATVPTIDESTPTLITGNDDGAWESFTVDVSGSNLRLNATYAPLFDLNSSGTTYINNMDGLSARTTSAWQKLLKTKDAVTSDFTVSSDLLINLQSYTLGGGYVFNVASGKTLGLQASTGVLNNYIKFNDTSSILQLLGTVSASILGSGISSSSTASGIIILGDGTTTSSLTVNSALASKFNSKVSKIVVKSNSTLTVTPE